MDRKAFLEGFYRAAYQVVLPSDELLDNAFCKSGLLLEGQTPGGEYRSVWHAMHAALQAAYAGGLVHERDALLARLWGQLAHRVNESADDPRTFVELINTGYYESAMQLRRSGFRMSILSDAEISQIRTHLANVADRPSARDLLAATTGASIEAMRITESALDSVDNADRSDKGFQAEIDI